MASRGGQLGNNNAGRGRKASDALDLALKVQSGEIKLKNIVSSNGMKALVDIWLKQLKKSIEDGDNGSAAMIVDRLEGRPAQSVSIEGELGLKEVRDLSDDELKNIASSGSE
jgi:hypothetical protein